MANKVDLLVDGGKVPMRYGSALSEEEKKYARKAYQEHVDRLCEELRPFLLEEAASGNWIAEVWGGWPHPDSLYIMLGAPFRKAHGDLPAGLAFIDVNDPHYWKAEISCERTHHTLACRF